MVDKPQLLAAVNREACDGSSTNRPRLTPVTPFASCERCGPCNLTLERGNPPFELLAERSQFGFDSFNARFNSPESAV